MTNLKFLLLFSLFFSEIAVMAQSADNKLNKISLGYNLSQFQNDFGLGLDVLSPYFLDESVAFKIAANIQWMEHPQELANVKWSPYTNIRFGVRGRQFVVDNKISVYVEGGGVVLLPNSNFSSKKSNWGGYGVFGFELNPSARSGVFVELGGVGTGAKANKIAGNPIYSNGFITSVGIRYYF